MSSINEKRSTPVVLKMINRFLKMQRLRGYRTSTIRTQETCLGQFANRYGERQLNTITLDELRDFCQISGLSPRIWRTRTQLMSAFYRFAIKNGWATDNLTKQIPLPAEKDPEPRIVTVSEARRLLAHADEFGLLPYVAIGLFAGIRTYELMHMDWSDVHDRDRLITIRDRKHSRHQPVPYNDTLAAWLPSPIPRTGPIIEVKSFHGKLKALLKKVRICMCPSNWLRVSFATYHLAAFDDPARTATILGHQATSLLLFYPKGRVSKDKAKKFWAIRPK